ncbi:MAG TPA: type I-C CRISPR-associated protein Cas8c/Csd1 [Polyangiaceae bacterium]|nr:type I-C CRISPR-associated protein Cas8c/Csd1 [Polyangiaceae bacterium]
MNPVPLTQRAAYLLGCLFALLERIEAAALGEAPREASDRQFGEASRAPAGCFPALLRAAHHYATRSHEGPWLERSAGEVLAKLPEGDLPAELDREGRRWFALGYAHERAAFFEHALQPPRPSAPPRNSPDPRDL